MSVYVGDQRNCKPSKLPSRPVKRPLSPTRDSVNSLSQTLLDDVQFV